MLRVKAAAARTVGRLSRASGRGGGTTLPGRILLRQAESFLAAHGIVHYRTELAASTSPDEIHEKYLKSADLIVAGIHARRVFVDLFVGSFTNRLIDRGDTALFLSH